MDIHSLLDAMRSVDPDAVTPLIDEFDGRLKKDYHLLDQFRQLVNDNDKGPLADLIRVEVNACVNDIRNRITVEEKDMNNLKKLLPKEEVVQPPKKTHKVIIDEPEVVPKQPITLKFLLPPPSRIQATAAKAVIPKVSLRKMVDEEEEEEYKSGSNDSSESVGGTKRKQQSKVKFEFIAGEALPIIVIDGRRTYAAKHLLIHALMENVGCCNECALYLAKGGTTGWVTSKIPEKDKITTHIPQEMSISLEFTKNPYPITKVLKCFVPETAANKWLDDYGKNLDEYSAVANRKKFCKNANH